MVWILALRHNIGKNRFMPAKKNYFSKSKCHINRIQNRFEKVLRLCIGQHQIDGCDMVELFFFKSGRHYVVILNGHRLCSLF